MQLVLMANQLFKYYIGNTYLTNVPLLGLLLMGVIYDSGTGLTYRVMSVFRCCYVTYQMVVVTAIATMINTQVVAHHIFKNVFC
jgi:hypothetical protein